MKLSLTASAMVLTLCGASAFAQAPEIISTGNSGYISKMSNNGKWGISETASVTEGSIDPSGGVLFDLSTMSATDISHSSGLTSVGDVTNDGKIVVGSALNKPAYWSAETKGWTFLPLPKGYQAGRLVCVTPDGRYAAGMLAKDNIYEAYPVMYDLTTGEEVKLPNVPTVDMTHEVQNQTYFYDISPDGRYLLGMLSFSYVMPPSLCTFVYDRQEQSYQMIGFDENPSSSWNPWKQHLIFCDFPQMSPNGEWITGTAYMGEPQAGSDFLNEYKAVYAYNIASKKFEIYNGSTERNIDGISILNDGTVCAATPTDNPYAHGIVRSGNYYVTIDQILRQNYGIDFEEATGWANTGKLIGVCDDSKTFITLVGPTKTYLIRFPETVQEEAKKVDLLGTYNITPAAGTVMSKLKTFKILFDREIQTNGAANKITFTSSDGSISYKALQATVNSDNPTTLNITFRTQQLETGKNYKLNIPAGYVSIKGDKNVTNKEMNFSYGGHDDAPAAVIAAYPADNASVVNLSASENPIVIDFDLNVVTTDNAAANIYFIDEEGNDMLYSALVCAASGNKLFVYPFQKINLFEGSKYKVVIPAGVVTDISGGCANEEIVLNYNGAYVRQSNPDDLHLFNEDCSSYDYFMFYEGDHRQPIDDMLYWNFLNADQYPWTVVRESNETDDMAFASHSMYKDHGQANDWCVTANLEIPDEKCYLQFDAQSYLFSKEDYLKVIVYTNDKVINTLTPSIIADIEKNGDVVFNERLNPGQTEEGLAGEWTNYKVDLDKYAGKQIYICFVNQNTDQSAVIIDNIKVIHDLSYLVSFENVSRVVDQESIAIRGNIVVASKVETYKTAEITLYDGDGKVVDSIKEDNLALKENDHYIFRFKKELPLEKGAINKYSVDFLLNDDAATVKGEVKNLTFEPEKHIVLEEYSGRDCGNCPLGIVAMENIQKRYPGKMIPVAVLTYQGDPLGSGLSAYSGFLGMESAGAPSGRINRSDVLYPMVDINGDISFSGAEAGTEVWLDRFVAELAEPAEAEITFTSVYDEATQKATVKTETRNALNAENTAINIFAVVLENGLIDYQSNYYSSSEDPDLGEWGKGGQFGQSYAYPVTKNHVARGTWGYTFNGTGGLIPANITAGEVYENEFKVDLPATVTDVENCELVVMLINAATGKILNANVGKFAGEESGISNVLDSSAIRMFAHNGKIFAVGADKMDIYSVAGQLIASAKGDGNVNVDLSGYAGVVIVKATDAKGAVKVGKFTVK